MKIIKAALLGRSLGHSISPEVHRALFDIVRAKCDTDYDALDYSKIECPDEQEFLSHVACGRAEGYRGFNVTFPYKFVASNIGEDPSPMGKHIRSANVILCDPIPRVISTDGNGFRFALEKMYPELKHKEYKLTILGAGGAARAVLHTTKELGWRKIAIAARSMEEAHRTAQPYDAIGVSSLDELSRDAAKQFIVQATPVGQRTNESLLEHFAWSNGDIAVDLVYNPLRTRFLDNAANRGAEIVDGLGMLMEQAALSQYFLMTGKETDHSLLTHTEFPDIHASLSKLLTPRWDAFGI
jgi:shikimate dehydrogenase